MSECIFGQRGAQHLGSAALVEAARVVASRRAPLTADRHGRLNDGRSGFSAGLALQETLFSLWGSPPPIWVRSGCPTCGRLGGVPFL
jgi:hypothetical protein